MPKFFLDSGARPWISGFVLAGVLVGLLGSLLITWRYQIDTDPKQIGLHFLFLNAGYVAAAGLAQKVLRRRSIRFVSLVSCAIAFASLIALTFVVPPVSAWYRMASLSLVGIAGGGLMTSLLYGLEPYLDRAPAAALNVTGLLFGSGCLLATLIVGIAYALGSVQIETTLLAVIPLIYAVVYWMNRDGRVRERVASTGEAGEKAAPSFAAVLFSLLLFFQFGNEWAIAGWLPLFLIHRLGSSPDLAIFTLALYFLALILGRLAARALLPRVNHRKMLLVSILLAMFGYLLLSFTDSLLGAVGAIVVIGAGFAPVYPILAETLEDRFRYRPGLYNGIFSIAMTGAMFAPWMLGYVDFYLGMRYVMLLPAVGSGFVFLIALLIMLAARVRG